MTKKRDFPLKKASFLGYMHPENTKETCLMGNEKLTNKRNYFSLFSYNWDFWGRWAVEKIDRNIYDKFLIWGERADITQR